MKNYKNKFITFEGTEGSGKSTIIKLLSVELQNNDINHFVTREPGGNGLEIAEDIRNIILENGEIHQLTELLLYEASRKEHLDKKIIPELEKGNIVLCDRFTDSSIAYQGSARKLGVDIVKQLNEIVVGKYAPSLTIFFDIKPEESLKRIFSSDREVNRFDKYDIKFHNNVYDAYKKLIDEEPGRFAVVDASKSVEEVLEDVKEIIFNHVKN
ncbi:MAG: dTMP kinase [Tenericutes bacterium]|nr:MAG: dTMP kinase [Mycoplasmatota bacterium]